MKTDFIETPKVKDGERIWSASPRAVSRAARLPSKYIGEHPAASDDSAALMKTSMHVHVARNQALLVTNGSTTAADTNCSMHRKQAKFVSHLLPSLSGQPLLKAQQQRDKAYNLMKKSENLDALQLALICSSKLLQVVQMSHSISMNNNLSCSTSDASKTPTNEASFVKLHEISEDAYNVVKDCYTFMSISYIQLD